MWVEIVGGCMAVAAVLAGVVGIVVSIRETDAERASTYPRGSTERRMLTDSRCSDRMWQETE